MKANVPEDEDRCHRGIGATLLLGAVVLGSTASAEPAGVAHMFEDFVRPGEPGCSVAVMHQGKVIHASAYGLAEVAERKPLTPGSVFNIGSVSKQFTAFSILLLEQRGKLSVDDPLTRYVPELATSAKGVTLRHLIHHTGGLRDYMDLLTLGGRTTADGATQHETVQLLARQRAANSPPGAEYAYSNTGYVLLATVVERVSGRSMKQFVRDNVFEPLGMSETTIVDRYPAGLPKLARGYTKNGDGFEIDESAWEQVGDGQVHTTVTDLFRWAENLHTGQVGGRELMARLVEPGALASGEPLDYAAGLTIGERNGRPTVSHGGGWAGYRSFFLHFPDQRLTVNVFCNRNDLHAGRFATAVADLYLDGEMPSPFPAFPADDEPDGKQDDSTPTEWRPDNLADFEGAYWSEEAQARCVLVQRGGQLVLEGCAGGFALRPVELSEFHVPDIGARIRFGEQTGPASRFSFHSDGIRDLVFIRQ